MFRYEVKCGAESGDLVEFTLRTHPEHGKVAKRLPENSYSCHGYLDIS